MTNRAKQTVAQIFIILLFSLGCAQSAQAQYATRVWQHLMLNNDTGAKGLFFDDFNADGQPEILLSGAAVISTYAAEYFALMHYWGGNYETKWQSSILGLTNSPVIRQVRQIVTDDLDGDGRFEIYVIYSGEVEVYSTPDFKLIATKSLGLNITGWATGDMNNDGAKEIIIASDDFLRILRWPQATVLWDTIGIGGADLVVADVNGDKHLEIITTNERVGYVIDGQTHRLKWTYLGGFGTQMQLADTDNDHLPEIVGASPTQFVTIFDPVLRSPVGQIQTGIEQSKIEVGDADNDGRIDVVIGDGHWGEILCYDLTTLARKWVKSVSETIVTGLLIADTDRDQAKEVVAFIGKYNDHRMYVLNGKTGEEKWRDSGMTGPYAITTGDLDNDGKKEIVLASRRSYEYSEFGRIASYDAVTHIRKWLSPEIYQLLSLRVLDVDDDSAPDLLCSAFVPYNGFMICYDPARETRKWISRSYDSQIVGAMEIAHLDNDGHPDIVVGLGVSTSGSREANLVVLDARLGMEKWKSPNLLSGTEWGSVGAVRVADIDGDQKLEIVTHVVDGALFIFDAVTRQIKWQSPTNLALTGLEVADLDEDGRLDILAAAVDSLMLIDGTTHAVKWRLKQDGKTIRTLRAANLDKSPGKEIVFGTDFLLRIVDYPSGKLLYEDRPPAREIGFLDNVVIEDIEEDGRLDMLVGTSHGVYQYLLTGDLTQVSSRTSSDPPTDFALLQNFPNPFNAATTIRFALAAPGSVNLAIYNISGAKVRTLLDEILPAQSHFVRWDGNDDHGAPLPSGVYIYRLAVAGRKISERKLLLLK